MLYWRTWEKARLFLPVFWVSLLCIYAADNFHTLLTSRNEQTLTFNPISGPIVNPLMGWAPWATIQESKQPHTLVYVDLTWRDFEPQPGVFDFASFEKKQQFDRWRTENKRVVFRFVCDAPGKTKHLDIPDWLFNATGGSGDYYDNAYGKGFSPDYSNPVFIQFHKKAIKAIGDRYGKDGFFAYIELGSLGHWGEWHVDFESGIRRLPAREITDQYVKHYIEAFPDTFLLMRRPFSIAGQYHLGLYNDMTGSPSATNEWLDWVANGGEFDQTGEPGALSPMPDFWKTAPVGGEQTHDRSNAVIYGKGLDQTLNLFEKSHITFVGPNGPYDQDRGGPLQSGIDRAMERIGYRIYIRQARMPLWIRYESSLNLLLTFSNAGAAPILYNWPVRIYLFDAHGNIVKTFQPEMDLRKILPGEYYSKPVNLPLGSLGSGAYTIGFAIVDPKTNQPAVKLAMDTARKDLIQEIGLFEIRAKPGAVTR